MAFDAKELVFVGGSPVGSRSVEDHAISISELTDLLSDTDALKDDVLMEVGWVMNYTSDTRKNRKHTVFCPICKTKAKNRGGSTKNSRYKWMCMNALCMQIWTEFVTPLNGERGICLSQTSKYKCSKCGKPKLGHKCDAPVLKVNVFDEDMRGVSVPTVPYDSPHSAQSISSMTDGNPCLSIPSSPWSPILPRFVAKVPLSTEDQTGLRKRAFPYGDLVPSNAAFPTDVKTTSGGDLPDEFVLSNPAFPTEDQTNGGDLPVDDFMSSNAAFPTEDSPFDNIAPLSAAFKTSDIPNGTTGLPVDDFMSSNAAFSTEDSPFDNIAQLSAAFKTSDIPNGTGLPVDDFMSSNAAFPTEDSPFDNIAPLSAAFKTSDIQNGTGLPVDDFMSSNAEVSATNGFSRNESKEASMLDSVLVEQRDLKKLEKTDSVFASLKRRDVHQSCFFYSVMESLGICKPECLHIFQNGATQSDITGKEAFLFQIVKGSALSGHLLGCSFSERVGIYDYFDKKTIVNVEQGEALFKLISFIWKTSVSVWNKSGRCLKVFENGEVNSSIHMLWEEGGKWASMKP